MPFKPHLHDIHNAGFTSLQGRIEVTFTELVQKLGTPGPGDGEFGKVQAEWVIDTPLGVVTVYDYKQYDTNAADVTDWHLGGHDRHSVEVFAAQHGWAVR